MKNFIPKFDSDVPPEERPSRHDPAVIAMRERIEKLKRETEKRRARRRKK